VFERASARVCVFVCDECLQVILLNSGSRQNNMLTCISIQIKTRDTSAGGESFEQAELNGPNAPEPASQREMRKLTDLRT